MAMGEPALCITIATPSLQEERARLHGIVSGCGEEHPNLAKQKWYSTGEEVGGRKVEGGRGEREEGGRKVGGRWEEGGREEGGRGGREEGGRKVGGVRGRKVGGRWEG